MYSDDDLNAAVDAGIFDADTAQAFRTLVAQRQHTLLADEEHFRLLSGFNDIFVVIACVLLLGSVAWLAGSVAPLLGAVGVAASAWGLAEFFVRQRRMALPAIALLAAFVGASAVAMLIALGEQSRQDELVLLAASSTATVAAWLHWRRFRVPLTVAAGAAAALGMVIALLLALWPALDAYTNALLLAGGSVCFVLAMHWDRQDPARQQRQSDVAFWLHLLAAPLLVHPFFDMLGILHGGASLAALLAVLGLYALFAVLSLAIDRRALMVSALAYVLYAFSQLLQTAGLEGAGYAVAGLLIGGGLLTLSAFWQRCRSALLPRLPARWLAGLPPLKPVP